MGQDEVRGTLSQLLARRPPAAQPLPLGNALQRWEEAVQVAAVTAELLPPVLRNRADLRGRLEVWAKGLVARCMRWCTWAQVEHNRAVDRALGEAHALVAAHAERLQALHEAQRAELVARERHHAERRAELTAMLEHRLQEQEVRLRQLELLLSETHQLADRFRRGATLRLEDLETGLAGKGAVPRRLP
jgi:hypothetical protein